MPPSSSFWLMTIGGGTVGAVLGALIGYAIDNWPQLRGYHHQPFPWLLRLRFMWENCVTREWERLTPLLEERDRDTDNSLASDPPTISCPVCHGLSYETPHREQTPGEWKMRPGVGFDSFIEDLECPYPRTCDWVISAIQGCGSCQIVVDAVASYSPELFKDYMPQSNDLGLGSTHIRAMANQAKPLGIAICKPWIPWQSEREEYLEVFTEVDSSRCWPTIGPGHSVCPNNHGPQALEKLKRWIETCKSKHTLCTKKNSQFFPRRLIQICENDQIRLNEPKEPCSYVALSYCWGTRREGWLRTLKSNIDQHKDSIDKAKLPQGLSDAIVLTKVLGFRFIWIDALCIVQDDDADLNSELVRMGVLYACADLVIGVDTISDCTCSLKADHAFAGSINYYENGSLRKETFQSSIDVKPFLVENHCLQKQTSYEPYFLRLKNKAKRVTSRDMSNNGDYERSECEHQQQDLVKLYVRQSRVVSHENHSIKNYWKHLDTRCWTLQESQLASRFLVLGKAEMKWRCVEASFCECYESSTEFGRDSGFVKHTPFEFRRQLILTQRMERKQTKLFSMLTSEDYEEVMDEKDLFEAWELLVSDFSGRNISHFGDRLPAISGVMSVFDRKLSDSSRIGDPSLAGLWKKNILRGMLWRSAPGNERPARFYSRGIIAPGVTQIEPSVFLNHFRLGSLLGNIFTIHAYACGKPCFASSIYWPMLNDSPNPKEHWPTDNVPSWSWLSVLTPVKYLEWLHGGAEMLELQLIHQLKFVRGAHVIHAYTWPSSEWKEKIPCGEIRLRCRLKPVKIKSVLHGMRDPDLDFCELYQQAKFDEDKQTLPFLIPPLLQSFTHFASLENSPALMQFIPDTPCAFGGNDSLGQPCAEDGNQWLIDLINQEYQFLLQQRIQRGGHSVTHPKEATEEELPDLDYDFHSFMPCVPSKQLSYTMASNTMCMKPTCGCGRRWTDPESYPAKAIDIGSCLVDSESGRRLVHRYALILMPSLHRKERAYHRIGIAIFKQRGSFPGFHDPFKDADWEEVTII